MKIINDNMFINEENDLIIMNKLEKFRIINWALYDNKYYYIKKANKQNEIVGELLAKHINLDTAHYEPVMYGNTVYYASENFKKPGLDYKFLNDMFKISLKDKLDELKETMQSDNFEDLKNDILKMYAVDIYMKQVDRCYINFMFEINNGFIKLAPLYDYSNAFMTDDYHTYRNPLKNIEIKELNTYFKNYPKLEYYINQLISFDILNELYKILENYELKGEYSFYEEEFKKSKKMIKGR